VSLRDGNDIEGTVRFFDCGSKTDFMEMLEHLNLEYLWVRETERVPTGTATPPTAVG
jgi:hypothetical protein